MAHAASASALAGSPPCDKSTRTGPLTHPAWQICSLLHQRYADFGPKLVQQLQRALVPPKVDKEDERAAWLTRQRSLLRLLAELHLVRVIAEPAPVALALKDAVSSGRCTSVGYTHTRWLGTS